MSQNSNLEQEAIAGGGNSGTGFATGSICPQTGLYKATDGKIEFIEYYSADDEFRSFPGGTGTKKCVWTRVTLASDGNKTSFSSVKVAAGTA